jgi:hypothetical protein
MIAMDVDATVCRHFSQANSEHRAHASTQPKHARLLQVRGSNHVKADWGPCTSCAVDQCHPDCMGGPAGVVASLSLRAA